VTTTSASSRAAAAEPTAATSASRRSSNAAAKDSRLSGVGEYTRTSSKSRTVAVAFSCPRACAPEPIIASVEASSRARASTPTAPAAPVLKGFIDAPSSSATIRPESASNSGSAKWTSPSPKPAA
jgi:hypothetical protein